jgi:hypothetical protein
MMPTIRETPIAEMAWMTPMTTPFVRYIKSSDIPHPFGELSPSMRV